MRSGSEYAEGHETEENYMETALILLAKINDQFIFYSPILVHSVLDSFYNVYKFFQPKGTNYQVV